jgi:hypothetical protein
MVVLFIPWFSFKLLVHYNILEWLWCCTVLLWKSPSWPHSHSRLIRHPLLLLTSARDTDAGFPFPWLGLAKLGLPRFEYRSKVLDLRELVNQPRYTSQARIYNTNSTEIIYTTTHDLGLRILFCEIVSFYVISFTVTVSFWEVAYWFQRSC